MTDAEKKELRAHPWTFYVPPFRIAGNLYFAGNRDAGAYILNTEEGLVLIDSTYPSTAPLLIQSIADLGFSVRNVRHLLHTHGHFDHFGCTGFVKAFSGCTTYLGRRDAEMFIKDPSLILAEGAGISDFSPFEPDVLLDGGETIRSGSTEISVVATPGHSDGCMSFFFYVEENGVRYRCGLFGGAGFNTLTDKFISEHGNTWSRQEYLDSLERLLDEDVDIMLGNHTGQGHMLEKHAEAVKRGDSSPFIVKNEFRDFILERKERFFRELCCNQDNLKV